MAYSLVFDLKNGLVSLSSIGVDFGPFNTYNIVLLLSLLALLAFLVVAGR